MTPASEEYPAGRGGRTQDREIVLTPNEYAFVMDTTKGNIQICVGPLVYTPTGNDQPVRWNPTAGKYERVNQESATCLFVYALEGDYVRLANPAKSETQPHPLGGSKQNATELNYGRVVNLRGPASFALWPGQSAQVIKGHSLKSNQFLLLVVTNEAEARSNWTKAVMEPQQPPTGKETDDEQETKVDSTIQNKGIVDPGKLTVGQRLIICGTECSFYMPPTGIEVVPTAEGDYTREAVTLERLEYCILLDENGNRRQVTGPDVVFPKPTESFVEDDQGSKVFKALELNELQGVYVKVTANYTEDDGTERKAGDELFITGKEQPVYIPREEHTVITYGDMSKIKHFAVAIPAGEGRYVMDRTTGNVETVIGPNMFLADPRKQLHIRRPLPLKLVRLLYPGNQEAEQVNKRLRDELASRGGSDEMLMGDYTQERSLAPDRGGDRGARRLAAGQTISSSFERGSQFTPPRTITLETKYDGAVQYDVWPGYATLIVAKDGKRRVVQGPSPVILDYGETPQVITLSTGTPKSDDRLKEDVFLKTHGNRVSDMVTVETKDLVEIQIRLSYRVNFEGNPEKWFALDNYIQFMCEHTRSLLRNAAHNYGVEEFYSNATNIVRDTILGLPASKGVEDAGKLERPGRAFAENGMRIYDVEVLDVNIDDDEISRRMLDFQHSTVQGALAVRTAKQELDQTRAIEETRRASLEERMLTEASNADAEMQRLKFRVELNQAKQGSESMLEREQLEAELRQEERRLQAKQSEQKGLDEIEAAKRERERASAELKHEMADKAEKLRLEGLNAEAEALVKKTGAITPNLIAALQGVASFGLADSMAKNFNVLAILQDKGVAEVAKSVFANTPLANSISQVLNHLNGPKAQV